MRFSNVLQQVLLCILSAMFITGCGLRQIVETDLESLHSPRLFDPNSSPFAIRTAKNDPNMLIVSHKTQLTLDQPCRVDYRQIDFVAGKVVRVDGTLPSGKTYPVLIDSGSVSTGLLYNPVTAFENDLEIFYIKPDDNFDSLKEQRGYGHDCYTPSIRIGDLIIEDPDSALIPWWTEFHILGLPIYRDKQIIMGIPLMRLFRYMRFDNPKMQLEFSATTDFTPGDPNEWETFRLEYKLNDFLYVDVPMGGQELKLQFDTGGVGIILKQKTWDTISSNLEITKSRESKFFTLQYGFLPCHKYTVRELDIGSIKLKNVTVKVVGEDSLYLGGTTSPGYISIWEFRDTELVLDFKKWKMWVKSTRD